MKLDIKRIRKEKGISQEELAEKSGVSRPTISNGEGVSKMLRPEEKSGLIIRSIDGKTDIYLNGVCINDKCLSCEVKIEGPYRPKATISLLCERVEMDIGKNVEVKKVGRSESPGF